MAFTTEATRGRSAAGGRRPRMIGITAIRDDPTDLGELAAGDVGEDLVFVEDHVVNPVRSRARCGIRGRVVRSAQVLNRVGPGPERPNRRRVATPSALGLQFVGQRGMVRAGIHLARLVAAGINHIDDFGQLEVGGLCRRTGPTGTADLRVDSR